MPAIAHRFARTILIDWEELGQVPSRMITRCEEVSMAFMKRSHGGIQPYIPCGMLRIRLPFVHFKISPPEVVTGLMNACTSYGALAVLTSTLGLDPEVAWALVVFETILYTCNWLLGLPSAAGSRPPWPSSSCTSKASIRV